MGNGTIYKSVEGQEYIAQHYENYINSFKFDVERIYVDTSYGKTHVIVTGPPEGKPVFIFQGGNCVNPMTLSWFSSLIDEYRIYAPDTIGHPGYSDENRISAKDNSFAQWIEELMNNFNIDRCTFIGPSYGAGIILRLASFMPNKIDCSILVSPAGIKLGSKIKMIKDILLPLVLFHVTSSEKHLNKVTGVLSDNSMKEIDKKIIGDVFKYTKLEQEMPKLTKKNELINYNSPTLIIAGKKDIFFPEDRINKVAKEIISNLTAFKTYDMGHFPSEEYLIKINNDIKEFLKEHY
ncbi:alpha/beta fold hydrolase [Domibacillus aminovorans]|uniref:Alpha/beta hydrolase n=1 Tax=Domibacillus aminovorans TaxID=29332 RepID=A0A177L5Q2_9BACI|nr:alpha/beta hydrolase [Domibacillus aminovorans]OAH61038.1 alpha/beta hydrolase [Domibacillus aminovorans]